MVHQSSLNTPNDISRAVLIFGIMLICIACLLIPGRCSVAICDDSIVLTSGSLSVMYFEIMTGAIVGVACLDIYMFAPEYAIDSVCLLGELCGVPILPIKLILGVQSLILFIIAPNRHSHHFSSPMTPICGLFYCQSRFYSHE